MLMQRMLAKMDLEKDEWESTKNYLVSRKRK